jgi:hypothetical protein
MMIGLMRTGAMLLLFVVPAMACMGSYSNAREATRMLGCADIRQRPAS